MEAWRYDFRCGPTAPSLRRPSELPLRKIQTIVVGSGISGLTATLLLALNGHETMLIEKAPRIGGSIARFRRNGVPFDVGFHFTGGLEPGGILRNLLDLLGMVDDIEPIFLPEENTSCFVFEDVDRAYYLPIGVERTIQRLKEYFPHETRAIEEYFRRVQGVCRNTPSLQIENASFAHPQLPEDAVSLHEVLCSLTGNQTLRGLLCGYAMCYGVRPSEISFANHSRMSLNFHQSIAYLKDGGDALVRAFAKRFDRLGVDVRRNTWIERLEDFENDRAGRLVLNTGEEISADNCLFTIHPRDILKLLPENRVRKAFVNRVMDFESSVGFFNVFATVGPEALPGPDVPSITSLFPSSDIDELLDPSYQGLPGLVAIRSVEPPLSDGSRPVHLLELAFPEATAAWTDTRTGHRPPGYMKYRGTRTSVILDHVRRNFPAYADALRVVDSASMLTFRDYLNNPDGSAYGIKQKMGQMNLVGRLPVRNLWAAGQSAILPGLIGAMMSAFIVGRAMIGKEAYENFLGGRGLARPASS